MVLFSSGLPAGQVVLKACKERWFELRCNSEWFMLSENSLLTGGCGGDPGGGGD